MKECPRCSHQNSERAMYCGNCGARLSGAGEEIIPAGPRTALLDPHSLAASKLGVPQTQTDVPKGAQLRVHFSTESKPMYIPLKGELLIGRRDPALPVQPDIDLSPYSGYRMGISRRHAKINYTSDGELLLIDLGSSNGTFLNGNKLAVHHSYRINEGDEIRLGQLIMVIYFEKGKEAKPKEATKKTAEMPAADTAEKDDETKKTLETLPLPAGLNEQLKALNKGVADLPQSEEKAASAPGSDTLAVSGEKEDVESEPEQGKAPAEPTRVETRPEKDKAKQKETDASTRVNTASSSQQPAQETAQKATSTKEKPASTEENTDGGNSNP